VYAIRLLSGTSEVIMERVCRERRARFSFEAGNVGKLKAAPSRLGTLAPRIAVPAKTAEPFYQSRAWRSLVASRKRDPDYAAALLRCRPGERVILDHVIERRDGGADLDPSNTEWLTHGEHQAKTARARAARARGETEGGGQKSGAPAA
jgi:5-methylcytosine-specific restriction protein A